MGVVDLVDFSQHLWVGLTEIWHLRENHTKPSIDARKCRLVSSVWSQRTYRVSSPKNVNSVIKLLILVSFQTRKTSVHLQNTNQDIFDGIWQLSDPPIDSKGPSTTKVQKLSKEIGKIMSPMWHQGFNRNFTKLREYFVRKEKKKRKNKQLYSNSSPPHHPTAILENIRWMQTAYALLCQPHTGCDIFIQIKA